MGIDNIKKEGKGDKKKLIISLLKVTVLLTIVVGVPIYIYFYHHELIAALDDYEKVIALFEKYETESVFIYIGIQILQIVISVIPGQVIQMAAGYLYSFWPALLFALIGAVLGTAITFLIAKILGRDFVHIFFGEEKMSYYVERLNSRKAYTIVFFLYLIPGLPKDMISYAAGVSEMNFKAFLILATIGRLPGMIGSILIGTMLDSENYLGVGIVGVIAVVAFLLCVIFRKKIHIFMDKFYDKITH